MALSKRPANGVQALKMHAIHRQTGPNLYLGGCSEEANVVEFDVLWWM